MINFSDLEQLAAFYHIGTLSEVAEKLNISQSTITRNMQKIEADFGVPLFIRTKNSIALNDSGILAAKQAEAVLEQCEEMFYRVRELDRMTHIISVGTCAPLPLTDIYSGLTSAFPNMSIATEMRLTCELLDGLKNNKYQLVILPCAPDDTDLVCQKISAEHLMFCLSKNHRLAHRKELSFAEINGENILILDEIGFWRSVVDEKLPDSHFLVQNEQYTFTELIENSLLPCFATDMTLRTLIPGKRIVIPISDPEAYAEYYLVCKKADKKRFFRLFS